MSDAFRVSFTPYLSHTKTVLNLISAYKKQPCLWDYDHDDYKNTCVKEDAWRAIALETGIPADICKRKMHSLQSQLRRERCKEREYRKNGRPNWRSKWYAYQAFKFLHGRTKTRMNNTENGDNDDNEVATTSDGAAVATATVETKIEEDCAGPESENHQDYPIENVTIATNLNDSAMVTHLDPIEAVHHSKHSMSEMNEKIRDEIHVYAETIAHRLGKLLKDPKSLCVTKNKIDNILFEAEMDMYEKYQGNPMDFYKLSPADSYHYSEANQ